MVMDTPQQNHTFRQMLLLNRMARDFKMFIYKDNHSEFYLKYAYFLHIYMYNAVAYTKFKQDLNSLLISTN